MSRVSRRLLRVAALASLAAAAPVQAHRLDEWLQATTVATEPDQLTLNVRVAPGAAVAAASIAEIDTDGDGRFSPQEQEAFARRIAGDLEVAIDGRPWQPKLHVSSFPLPEQIRDGTGDIILQFRSPLALAQGRHRITLHDVGRHPQAVYLVNALVPRAPSLEVLSQTRSSNQSSYELDLAMGAAATGPAPAAAESVVASAGGWTFFLHGLRHILTGYDHLLFAAALVLGVRGLRELVLVVTAFTLAHSLSLTLAVLGWVTLPGWIVEPMISLSIVFVALQNAFWPRHAHGRGRLLAAFCFGLFHGLGFAGGLLEVLQQMPGAVATMALVLFTLGVEAGQQLIVVPLFLLLARLRSHASAPRPVEAGRRWASGAVAVGGMGYLAAALGLIA